MKRKSTALSVLTASVVAFGATAPASSQTSLPCLAGRRAALVRGHFTGPLVCSKTNASFVLAGRTRRAKFFIYDYRYRHLPEGGNVTHGGQKVVVFRGKIYVGQYALSPPPYAGVTVSGTHVALRAADSPKLTILDFSRTPPRQILVGGDVATFSR